MTNDLHRFHIPVMGTGFTVDTPVKLARYGIHSVVSMGDDRLAERMRKAHAEEYDLPYTAILESEPDCRAKRFTAYLDQMQDIVDTQMAELLQLAGTSGDRPATYTIPSAADLQADPTR